MAGRRNAKRKAPVGNVGRPKRTQTSTTNTDSTAPGSSSSDTGSTSTMATRATSTIATRSTSSTAPGTGSTSSTATGTGSTSTAAIGSASTTAEAAGPASTTTAAAGSTSTTIPASTGGSSSTTTAPSSTSTSIPSRTRRSTSRVQTLPMTDEDVMYLMSRYPPTPAPRPIATTGSPTNRVNNMEEFLDFVYRFPQTERTPVPALDADNIFLGADSNRPPTNSNGGSGVFLPPSIGITPSDCSYILKISAAAAAKGRLFLDPNNPVLPFFQLPRTILLDCRIPEDFSKTQINFLNVVNVPPFVFDSDASQKFKLKEEVYKFIQEKIPELLEKLNSPGYYANIILVDETSTAKVTSHFLKVLRLAMIKWNETTKTNIKLIEGGFVEFSKLYPEMIKQLPRQSPTPGPCQQNTSQNFSSEAMRQGMESPENKVKDMLSIMKMITKASQIFYSLGCVKQALILEHESVILKYLEAQFPDTVRCPVCLETYSAEILQCGNGHCICGTCAGKITSCPECRLRYNGIGTKIRNRSLENLIANYLKCVCTCGDTIMCRDAQSHAKMCALNKNKSEEVVKLEAVISLMETEIQKMDQNWIVPGSMDKQRKEKHNLFLSMAHKL